MPFRALLLHDARDPRPEVASLPETDLPEGDVLLDVAYSSLNYKDGLAVTGRGKIVRGAFPFVPGIDLAGTVAEDASGTFRPGEGVILTGWGTGEDRWGGFAQKARAHPDHLVRLPEALSPRQAMVLGTAGFTAMLAVMALEEHDVTPDHGEVVVTGASGGAGSVAVALLARLGYRAVASTGKEEAHDYLVGLGAARCIGRDELGGGPERPMERARWAGAVDAVGGPTLAALLAQTQTHGSVAAFGLAQSHELHTTVFPFILRGVNLLGIDSNTCPPERRERAWARLRELLTDADFERLHHATIGLGELPAWSDRITRGETRGRVVVDVSR
jgi:acrylyl-CoA reductase (NADPH)